MGASKATRTEGSPREPLSAAVLAGGLSRRMGQDKALLSLRAGEPPMAAMVLDRVAEIADDVFVVSDERPGYDRLGVPLIPDRYPGSGVLGGIATALQAARHEHCLVVACDMPFLSLPLLRWMAEQERGYDVLVPRLPGRSRQGEGFVYQTLHAIYGAGCLAAIEAVIAADRLQVIGFFPSVRVRAIEQETVARLDSSGRSFFNANSPAAAAAAARLLDQEPLGTGLG